MCVSLCTWGDCGSQRQGVHLAIIEDDCRSGVKARVTDFSKEDPGGILEKQVYPMSSRVLLPSAPQLFWRARRSTLESVLISRSGRQHSRCLWTQISSLWLHIDTACTSNTARDGGGLKNKTKQNKQTAKNSVCQNDDGENQGMWFLLSCNCHCCHPRGVSRSMKRCRLIHSLPEFPAVVCSSCFTGLRQHRPGLWIRPSFLFITACLCLLLPCPLEPSFLVFFFF